MSSYKGRTDLRTGIANHNWFVYILRWTNWLTCCVGHQFGGRLRGIGVCWIVGNEIPTRVSKNFKTRQHRFDDRRYHAALAVLAKKITRIIYSYTYGVCVCVFKKSEETGTKCCRAMVVTQLVVCQKYKQKYCNSWDRELLFHHWAYPLLYCPWRRYRMRSVWKRYDRF